MNEKIEVVPAQTGMPAVTVETPKIVSYVKYDQDGDSEYNDIDHFSGGRRGGIALVSLTDAINYAALSLGQEQERQAARVRHLTHERDLARRDYVTLADASPASNVFCPECHARESTPEDAAPQQHAQAAPIDDLPPLPDLDTLADMERLFSTPADWDADYRNTWQKLQVAERNKMQWRVYALKLHAVLAASRQPAAAPIPDQTCDIFDLIREWAHLPEGDRGDVARQITGHLNQSYMAGVKDTRFLIAAEQPVAAPAIQQEAAALARRAPSLTSVIHWLEGGCDPRKAANELRAYQRQMVQQEAPVLAGETPP